MEWVEGAELFGATRSIFEVEPVYLPIAVFPESLQLDCIGSVGVIGKDGAAKQLKCPN